MSSTHLKRILKLKAQLAALESAAKMKPTGAYLLSIIDNKGTVVRTFILPDQRSAILKRNDFYQVLVTRLKQKVTLSVKKEYKSA